MKSRRVLVSLEIETDEDLKALASAGDWNCYWLDMGMTEDWEVIQASANVIRPERAAKAKKVKP